MKKLLIALAFGGLLIGCVQEEAEAVEFENGVSVSAGDTTLSFNQDGDEFAVGWSGASVYHNDNVEAGISFEMNVVGSLSTKLSYEYTNDDDSIIGIETPILGSFPNPFCFFGYCFLILGIINVNTSSELSFHTSAIFPPS